MYWPFKIWDVGTLWYGPNVHSNCCWHWLKRLRYLHVLAVFFTLQQPLTSEKACVYQYFIDKFTTITLFYNIGIMYFFRHVRNLCWKLLVLWLHRVCKWRLDSRWHTDALRMYHVWNQVRSNLGQNGCVWLRYGGVWAIVSYLNIN